MSWSWDQGEATDVIAKEIIPVKNEELVAGREGLRPFDEDDVAHIGARYAVMAAQVNGTEYAAEMDRFRAWVTFMQQQATLNLERMVQELEAENTRLKQERAEAESRLTELPKPRSLEYPASEFEGLTEQKIASEYAFAVAGGSVSSFEAERERVLAWAAHIRAEAAEAALAGDLS